MNGFLRTQKKTPKSREALLKGLLRTMRSKDKREMGGANNEHRSGDFAKNGCKM